MRSVEKVQSIKSGMLANPNRANSCVITLNANTM